ncbi:MAG: AraC family transcriptional regulator [Pseudomonadota bacterium]
MTGINGDEVDVVVGGGLTAHVNRESANLGSEYSTLMGAGWWYGVVLSGEVDTEQPGFGRGTWKSDTFIHFWSEDAIDTFHRVVKNTPMSAVFVHIQPEAASLLLGDDMDLVAGAKMRKSNIYRSGHITQSMGQIARQMLTTTRYGTDRRLYLAGRAHDLIGSVVEHERSSSDAHHAVSVALTRQDFGRISDAVDIVLGNLDAPPTCSEIASQVGLSPKKLARGFKAVHGLTLGAFVKEKRMELARRMLEDGAPSVSAVAYRLGYHPAHFATEFKRRFGFSPSSLILK